MTDRELRELCQRFFDTIERGDYDEIGLLYASGSRIWVNLTGTESTAEESVAVLRDGAKRHRRRSYDVASSIRSRAASSRSTP